MVACWPCKSDFSRLVGAKSWAYIFWSEQDLEGRCKVWTHDCRLLLHYSSTFTQWNAFLETIRALDFLMWLVSPKTGRLITILHLTFIMVLHKYREEGVGKWKFLSIKLFTLKIKTSGLREKRYYWYIENPLILRGVKSQRHCFLHRHWLAISQESSTSAKSDLDSHRSQPPNLLH